MIPNMIPNHPSYNARSPDDSESCEAMARAQRMFRVVAGTGKTVLRTRSGLTAFETLDELDGAALFVRHGDGPERTLSIYSAGHRAWAKQT